MDLVDYLDLSRLKRIHSIVSYTESLFTALNLSLASDFENSKKLMNTDANYDKSIAKLFIVLKHF